MIQTGHHLAAELLMGKQTRSSGLQKHKAQHYGDYSAGHLAESRWVYCIIGFQGGSDTNLVSSGHVGTGTHTALAGEGPTLSVPHN